MALTTTPSELTATALTLTTAAQPNITSVGTLTALTGGTGDLIWDTNTLVVDSSTDRVGIGDTAPSQKLTVNGNINVVSGAGYMFGNGAVQLYSNQTYLRMRTNSTDRLTIENSGNVGIGTTAPGAGLEVLKSGGGKIRISETADKYVELIGYAEGAANGSTMAFHTNQAGTSTSTERMRIDSTGKVGIGNTNPNRQLSIKHASQAEIGFKTGSVSNGALIYYNDSENQLLLRAQESGEHIAFQTGGTTERMRINSDGNVLIGTDAAYDKFVVGRTSTSQTAGMTLVNLQNGGYGSGITWECKRSDANNVQTAARLYVAGASSWNSDSTASSQFIFFLRSANTLTERLRISHDGTFTGSGSNDISDQRLKENIKTIPNALTTIKGLTGRTFTWKEKAKQPSGTKYGFLAQEVQSVVSDLVNNQVGILKIKEDESVIYEDLDAAKEGEWAKSVQTTGIIPILVEAIKELAAKVEALESK